MSKYTATLIKILSIIGAMWSILLLVTETTLIFSTKEAVSASLNNRALNVWFTFSFTMVVMGGIVATAFFTIFKLKFSDYLQMVPKHTDVITMTQFTGFFS